MIKRLSKSIACASLLIGVFVGEAAAQEPAWRIGFGAGASIISGTPDRPWPMADNELTGAAGPDQGFEFRLASEMPTGASWFRLRGDLFFSRLTTSEKYVTLNCLGSPEPRRKQCYPAAAEDALLGFLAGPKAIVTREGFRPSATLQFGVGRYSLQVNKEHFPTVESATYLRPIVHVGVAVERDVGPVTLSLESGLTKMVFMQRGGGTARVPITLVGFWEP